MGQKIITIILGLIVVGGLAWYIDKNYVKSNASAPTPIGNDESDNSDNASAMASSLVYANRGAATEIWAVDSFDKTKKLYTDADESLKIKKISNLANTYEVLAIVSGKDGTTGKLVAINLAEAKQKTLKDLFPLTDSLALSPDGEWFSYVKFSNVEDKYGYTLYAEQKNGNVILEATNSSSELISPCWNTSSTKIFLGETVGAKTEIVAYDLDLKKAETIATLEDLVDWISCAASDKIILSTRKIGANSAGKISQMDADGQNLKTLVEYSGGKAAYAYLSTDQKLAYLVAQYKNNIDDQTSGQIYVFDAKKSLKSAIRRGVQILGWKLE